VQIISDTVQGTGVFYHGRGGEKPNIPLILTNKHIINGAKNTRFVFHKMEKQSGKNSPSLESIEFPVEDISTCSVAHPVPDIDLAAIVFQPILEKLNKSGNEIFYRCMNDALIKTDDELRNEACVADDVLMVGYPLGMRCETMNYPIVRKGITATHPAIDFKGESIGLVDIACFPGSSGSPILIWQEGFHTDRKGGINIGGSKLILLGLLSSGYFHSENTKIKVEKIATEQTATVNYQQMSHLGRYVKAKEISVLVEKVCKVYKVS